MKQAIFHNLKLSIFVYLIVALICTCAFIFLPRNLQSNIEMLRESVQSKQLLVNSLKEHSQKKEFTVPKEATTWINQLPPDPQINRALVQVDSLIKKTNVNFQSITLADVNAKDDNTTDSNQVLNDILGKAGQSSSGQKARQGSQTISLNLTIKGSYDSVLDFLYGLVHSERLIRIDSIQLTHDNSTGQQNRPINPQAQNGNSVISFQSGDSNANSMTTPQVKSASNTSGVSSKVSGTENHKNDSTAVTLMQSLQTGTLTVNSQPNANSNLGDMTKNLTPVIPVSPLPNDELTVNLVLSIFFMQDAAVLGSLPDLSLYPPSDRANPFVP